MTAKTKGLTFERAAELLAYDPETGVFRWRKTRTGSARAGSVAGSVNQSNGYIHIQIDGERHYGQRLAWLLHHGEWPSHTVDHINHVCTDNRISNLRAATLTQQVANSRGSSKLGLPKGVFRDPRRRRPYGAVLVFRGKRNHLGFFASPAEAHDAYMRMALAVHGEYACGESKGAKS